MKLVQEQYLQGGVDSMGAMRLLTQQKEELLQSGYDKHQIYSIPGIVVLKLEDGEVRWLLEEGTFKMELWKNEPARC